MKKTMLLGFSMVMMLPLLASASLTQKMITVVAGKCVSADQKFTAEVKGTRLLQRNLIFFEGKVLADILQIQLKEVATGDGVGLQAVDGQSDNLAFTLSDDGTRLNINAIYKGNAIEVDLTCKSEINERGMVSFIKQSR
jgi:hypothetical protein